MVNAGAGALALVLPSVVPTAPGNLAVRKYLGQHFHVETIVASHDPERIFFSENTRIGEVLLVCRRWEWQRAKAADPRREPCQESVNTGRSA